MSSPSARAMTQHISTPVAQSVTWPWGDATEEEWNDWGWQFRHRIRQLDRFLPLLPPALRREASLEAAARFPFSVTPHFAKLVSEHPEVPEIARLVLPSAQELIHFPGERVDPTGEEQVTPAPGLRHLYPDRVLYTLTYVCPSYCRYCFRRRVVGTASGLPYPAIERGLDYIRMHKQIREVIISGGEPWILSDAKLRRLLADLARIRHVEVVRFHTRAPVFLPQRVTPGLIAALKTFSPVYVNICVTHPAELSPETREACNRLVDHGIPLGSQTPLLHGINDSVDIMRTLMLALLKERVRPYYIHNTIPVTGSMGFQSTIEKGIEIIQGLRGHISGLGVPTFSVFLSDAHGKVSLQPQYFVGRQGDNLVFTDYKDQRCLYPDPLRKRV